VESLKEKGTPTELKHSDEKIVGCPQFWVCAISQHDTVAETLSEGDVDCLEYLRNISARDNEDGTGFTLKFDFQDNPYFENKFLEKRYDIPNFYMDDEPLLEKIDATEIKWKEGQSLTHKSVTKKQRAKSGKKAGQIRTVTQKVRNEVGSRRDGLSEGFSEDTASAIFLTYLSLASLASQTLAHRSPSSTTFPPSRSLGRTALSLTRRKLTR